jgi:hypothetical protein
MMSGCTGYRGIGRFLKRHNKEFRKTLLLLHDVPSYVTVSTILQSIDFDIFSDAFNQWARQYVPMCKGDTKSLDGKAICGTVKNSDNSFQNFVSLVSVFASQRGIVLACDKIENKKESEIPIVQQLVLALDVKGEIFTIDALHCQKKRHK